MGLDMYLDGIIKRYQVQWKSDTGEKRMQFTNGL